MPVAVASRAPNILNFRNRGTINRRKSMLTNTFSVRASNPTRKNTKNVITVPQISTVMKKNVRSTLPENKTRQLSTSLNSYNTSLSHTPSPNMKQYNFEENEQPMYDLPIYLTEDDETYNDGSRSIEQSEKRASYYLQYLKEYYIPMNESTTVPDEQVEGLIIHYPGQRPMAFDSKTTVQYGFFDVIQAGLSEYNKPMLLITHDGLREVSVEDIKTKYNKILSKLFLS